MLKKIVSGITLTLLLIGIFGLALGIQPVKTEPRTIIVPDDYPTIQEAINNTTEGDTVFVRAGTYYEHVVVNETVSLIGENRSNTIIDGSGIGTVISVEADGVSVTEFTVQNSSSDSSDSGIRLEQFCCYGAISGNNVKNNSVGISLNMCGYCVVSSNDIIGNNGEGILLEISTNNIIEGNNVTSNAGYGIHLDGPSAYSGNNTISCNKITNSKLNGIYLSASIDNTITGNTIISNTLRGIYLSSSSQNMISGNIVTNNGDEGLTLKSSGGNIIISNEMTHNHDGIHLFSASKNNVLVGNNITENNRYGIFLEEASDNNNISSNNMTSNDEAGIWLDSSCENTVRANNITNNKNVGMGLWWQSNNNVIYHNNFINNPTQYRSYLSNNTWWLFDNGYGNITLFPTEYGGNYWSDQYHGDCADHYSGPDQNENGPDGIVDTPYDITDEGSQDKYPLMSQYVTVHDIDVTNVTVSQMVVEEGHYFFDIYVAVENLGDHFENFTVTAYYNLSVIGTVEVVNLELDEKRWLKKLSWDATEVEPGTYTIKAEADTVPGETNTANNVYVDGTLIHDVAVTNVTVSQMKAGQGNYFYNVDVAVENLGDWIENFTVTAYYNSSVADAIEVVNFKSGQKEPMTLLWDITELGPGNYTIRAEADTVPGETNTTNNKKQWDGTIEIGDIHNIAIRDVHSCLCVRNGTRLNKTIVCQTCCANITVTVENEGNFTETFDVTVYANTTVTQKKSISLLSGESANMTFRWNATDWSKGNYTIKAVGDTVLNETDPGDNTYIDDWIIVSMLGDITGPEDPPDSGLKPLDGKCDIKDVALVAKKFGAICPDSRYDPNCDLTGPTKGVPDGKIDIKDVALIAKHYGDIDP